MATMGSAPAIIVTLQLDEATQAVLERLRQAHFPPELNKIPAHLTLFHNLPGSEIDTVMAVCGAAAASTARFPIVVSEPIRLGRGTALRVEGQSILALRERLSGRFKPWLSGQDKQRFRPHVTIQNKVSAARASAFFHHMTGAFAPVAGFAEGLQLWHYLGGPWGAIGAVPFGAPVAAGHD